MKSACHPVLAFLDLRRDWMGQVKKPRRPSWAWPGIAGWAAGVGSVDTQNPVTIKGSNKGESYERGAGKEKQGNLTFLKS